MNDAASATTQTASPLTLFSSGPIRLLPGHLHGRRQASLLVSLQPAAPELLASGGAQDRFAALLQCWQRCAGAAAAGSVTTEDWWQLWMERLAAAAVSLLQGTALPLWDPPHLLALPAPDVRSQQWTQMLLPVFPGRAQASANAWQLALQAATDCVATGGVDAATRFDASLQQLKGFALHGGNSPRLLRAAMAQDVPVLALGGELFQFGQGRRAQWLESTFTLRTSNIGARLARDKRATNQRLRQAGLPVPRHHAVRSLDQALKAAQQLGYPVVVKPLDQDGGRGVAAGLQTEAELRAAYERACELSTAVLVEQHIVGRDYRLTVLDGELLWAIERIPAGVTGDGKRSIADLVAAKNARPQRGEGIHAVLKRLTLDPEAEQLLAAQGLNQRSVPAAGQFVRLSRIANVATGGQPVAVNDQVHPYNARLAVRAAAALRLDLAGVDLLLPDIARSWREGGAAICEVNAQPQLGATTGPHLYGEILQRRLGGNGRIPVLALLGAQPDSSLLSAVVSALSVDGLGVAWCARNRAGINGERLTPLASNLVGSTQMLLSDASVDILVLSLEDDDWLRMGLPVDRIDCLVLAGGTLLPGVAASKPEVATIGVPGQALPALLPAVAEQVLLLRDAGLDPQQIRQALPARCELRLVSRAACLRRLQQFHPDRASIGLPASPALPLSSDSGAATGGG